MADLRQPWERKDDEGAKRYEAFWKYLQQGTGTRSQRRVAEELGKSLTLISRWATEEDWTERVATYDKHMIDIMQAAIETETQEMFKRHVQAAIAFQNKVVERLREFTPDDLSPTQLIQWFEVATRIERQARGLPDLSLEQIIPEDPHDADIDRKKLVLLDEWIREEDEDDDDVAEAGS